MKVRSTLLLFILLLTSCKSDKKSAVSAEPDITILEKVAFAHGFENWKKVNEISFTFNVDRDSSHFERSWIWKPKSNDVTHISGNDTLTYQRSSMDSTAFKVNAGFINDRYWLLAPFNLIWDSNNFSYEHSKEEIAPISQESMHKLTIVYGNEGGYTPGDAYDFYLGDDFLIREWVFRKANQSEPSMTTTWENYLNSQGFKFALDHKKEDGNFNLYFDGVQISMEN